MYARNKDTKFCAGDDAIKGVRDRPLPDGARGAPANWDNVEGSVYRARQAGFRQVHRFGDQSFGSWVCYIDFWVVTGHCCILRGGSDCAGQGDVHPDFEGYQKEAAIGDLLYVEK